MMNWSDGYFTTRRSVPLQRGRQNLKVVYLCQLTGR